MMMNEITYLKGDATSPQAKGNKIICHICNDLGRWGKGFVMAISRRWDTPEKAYRKWHKERANNDFELGAIQVIQVESDIWVANMIGQRGIKVGNQGPPIRYEAVEKCLYEVNQTAIELNASVHMPKIGCGLGNGQIDLLIRHAGQLFGLELKSFANQRQYQKALPKVATYGKQLGVKEIWLVLFIETVDENNRQRFEIDYTDNDTGITVHPLFVQTGKHDS